MTLSGDPTLPADSTLLPLRQGWLLVSRGHALFCRIAADDAAGLRAVLAGQRAPSTLPAAVVADLARHGFFGLPRTPPPVSHTVQLQLTNACPLRCSYCCTDSGAARPTELGLADFQAIVDGVLEVHGPGTRVSLLGGEPFLRPWAIDLAEYIADRGLDLGVFSNGLPLSDPQLAPRVAALIRRGANARVSLAGPTRETCDAASGAPRFDGALAGLHAVARHGGLPIVDLMVLPDHVALLGAALPGLRRQLPTGTRIALGILFHGGREQGGNTFGSRSALEDALDRIAFDAGETIAASPTSPLTDRREGCSCALGHHLHVRSDGALFTCFKMEERVGWLAGQRFAAALRQHRAQPRPASTLPRCAACALDTLCGGGCRAENIQYTGDGDVPLCGPWRVQVLTELLAEDRPAALEWPLPHLLAEARRRQIDCPDALQPQRGSLHTLERTHAQTDRAVS